MTEGLEISDSHIVNLEGGQLDSCAVVGERYAFDATLLQHACQGLIHDMEAVIQTLPLSLTEDAQWTKDFRSSYLQPLMASATAASRLAEQATALRYANVTPNMLISMMENLKSNLLSIQGSITQAVRWRTQNPRGVSNLALQDPDGYIHHLGATTLLNTLNQEVALIDRYARSLHGLQSGQAQELSPYQEMLLTLLIPAQDALDRARESDDQMPALAQAYSAMGPVRILTTLLRTGDDQVRSRLLTIERAAGNDPILKLWDAYLQDHNVRLFLVLLLRKLREGRLGQFQLRTLDKPLTALLSTSA